MALCDQFMIAAVIIKTYKNAEMLSWAAQLTFNNFEIKMQVFVTLQL